MLKVATSCVILLGLTTTVLAADLPSVKESPAFAPAPTVSWGGFYGGANIGAGIGTNALTTSVPGAPNTLFTVPFDGSLSWGTLVPSQQDASFLGGLQLGYNIQTGIWVFGLETDIQWASSQGANSSSFSPAAGFSVVNVHSADTPWFGTVRGRIGSTFVDPSLLLYVTGGLAYGRNTARDLMTASTTGGVLVESFPFGYNSTGAGYTLGLGAEYALTSHWSIKAEYLYMNFGSGSSQSVATTYLGPSALSTDVMSATFAHEVLNVLRIGVNYRFGAPEAIVAKF